MRITHKKDESKQPDHHYKMQSLKIWQLQQGAMCQCVGIFILVNLLGCVSEQGLQMLGLLKLMQLHVAAELRNLLRALS